MGGREVGLPQSEEGNGRVYVMVSEAGGVVWIGHLGAVLWTNACPRGVIIIAVETQPTDMACADAQLIMDCVPSDEGQ